MAAKHRNYYRDKACKDQAFRAAAAPDETRVRDGCLALARPTNVPFYLSLSLMYVSQICWDEGCANRGVGQLLQEFYGPSTSCRRCVAKRTFWRELLAGMAESMEERKQAGVPMTLDKVTGTARAMTVEDLQLMCDLQEGR